MGDDVVALDFGVLNLFEHGAVLLGMFVAEAEVLQFCLDAAEPEAVGYGCEDVECLGGNLVLLGGQHGGERAHVVQAVADLDEDDAYVVAHHEKQLLEGFGLQRGAVAEDAAGYFRHALDDVGNLVSEEVGEVFVGVVGVFLYVVEQCGTDGGRAESDFAAGNLCHGDGVEYIGFARTSAHALMRLLGKVEGLGDEVYLTSVVRGQIGVDKALESRAYHFFVLLFLRGEGLGGKCVVHDEEIKGWCSV